MPVVSMIMPAFNSETTIQSSIDSVVNQSFRDLELIIVDDGSTDRTKEIINQNLQQDPRIKFIQVHQAGPGGAKNVGIDHAQGQYIGFIDSDDLLDVDFIIAGVERLQAGADCVIYDYIRFNQQEEIHNTVGDTPFTAFPATWNKLYRSELWTGIRFPEEILIEDFEVVPVVVSKASKIDHIHDSFYRYRLSNNSITTSYDYKRIEELEIALKTLVQNARTLGNFEILSGKLPVFANNMMYAHIREAILSAPNHKAKRKVYRQMRVFYRQLNVEQFNIRTTIYSPNRLKQIRNNLMVICCDLGWYTLGVKVTFMIEQVFGKRRRPRRN